MSTAVQQAPTEVIQPAPVVVVKKLDSKDPHAVHAEFGRTVLTILDTVASHSTRFFGTAGGYQKAFGLPEEAPKKKEFTNIKKLVRGLLKHETKKYNSVTTKDRRDADGNPRPRRTGMSRLVLCSPQLTKFMKLRDWNLMSDTNPERGYCTHGKVTTYIADYIKLNMLQDGSNAQCWKADKPILDLFGLAQFKLKGVDPNAVRFIDIQKLMARDKANPNDEGHLLSIKTGTLPAEVEADIRHKCSDDAESEFGGAIHKVHNLRTELKTASEAYIKTIKYSDAAKATRPGQEIAKLWEAEVANLEASYVKKAAEIRKCAESFNFSIATAFPPKLLVPPVREKKPRVTKSTTAGASNPATRAAATAK